MDGICIECDVHEDDFPDFYASAKSSRKISESASYDNNVITLSPLGLFLEKQL